MTDVKRVVQRFLEATEGKPYAALFLDEPSQHRLLSWWKREVGVPLHGDVKAHHMTLKFDPSPAEAAEVPVGTRASAEVVGYAADEKAQAVLVRSSVRSSNQHPHVTVAVAPGVGAVYSNTLLAQNVTPIKGPRLTGVVEIRRD